MKRLIGFSIILAIALSVMPAAQANAAALPPDSSYHSLFFNTRSGLCLQPEYKAAINGLTIVQQPCDQYDLYQRWWFSKVAQDTYRLVNSGSWQCLDDRDGATADGSPVQQWTCNSTSTTMQWRMEDGGGNPGYRFKNIRSGKCLDVRGGSLQPGAVLQIYRCTSTASSPNYAQLFYWAYVTHR